MQTFTWKGVVAELLCSVEKNLETGECLFHIPLKTILENAHDTGQKTI